MPTSQSIPTGSFDFIGDDSRRNVMINDSALGELTHFDNSIKFPNIKVDAPRNARFTISKEQLMMWEQFDA